jgi:release factor glutamine methyltransferase
MRLLYHSAHNMTSATDIRTALRNAIAQLDTARVDAPATTARLLLAHMLGKPKAWLVAHGDETLDARTQAHYAGLLQRVVAHEPMFYVLGHREFYGLDLLVDKRVLIPRPETEMLVELALAELRVTNDEWRIRNGDASFDTRHSTFDILDVGTGSGAVPIAVAKHAPNAKIIATDISRDALDVARMNAERHDVADRITFVQADLLDGIDVTPMIITANLPYVTREEIDGLPPEIQDHEPRVALDGGDDGLDLVRRLLGQIKTRRAERPFGSASLRAAYLEFGASQGAAVLQAAREILPNAHSEILKDLAKLDRVLTVRFG